MCDWLWHSVNWFRKPNMQDDWQRMVDEANRRYDERGGPECPWCYGKNNLASTTISVPYDNQGNWVVAQSCPECQARAEQDEQLRGLVLHANPNSDYVLQHPFRNEDSRMAATAAKDAH